MNALAALGISLAPRRGVLATTPPPAATAVAAVKPAFAAVRGGLDPVDPDILFGTTGSIFGVWNHPRRV